MSEGELHDVVRHVAELSSSALPLPAGLRAAAAECHHRGAAASLEELAAKIEAGQSLEAAISDPRHRWSGQFAALVRGAARTNDFGGVLAQTLEHQREARELQQSIRRALAYPALVLVLTALVLALLSATVVAQADAYFTEFELELPHNTIAVLWMGKFGIWLFLTGAVAVFVVPPLAKRIIGPPRWNSLASTLPLIGPAWRWSSIAESTRLLGVYLKHGIPLPESLRLTGDAGSDAMFADALHDLAADVERGQPLAAAIADDGRLPATMAPLVYWGEAVGALPEACEAIREMFEDRARLRVAWLRAVLPPIVFLVVGITVGSMVAALTLPMVELINKLS